MQNSSFQLSFVRNLQVGHAPVIAVLVANINHKSAGKNLLHNYTSHNACTVYVIL